MKTTKHDNLSVLSRTYVYRRGHLLLVAVFAGFRLEKPDELIDESDIWTTAELSLGDNDYLDQGYPRPSGEVILRAKCFTPGGKPVPACPVSFQVGKMSKTLYVFGDRQWHKTVGVYTGISDPVPFTGMDITWENAFGGEGCALNPGGKGMSELKDSGGHSYLPLPNIEDPDNLVCVAKKQYMPVSFDYMGPQRTGSDEKDKVGTYDEKWLIYNWPYLPDDFDLRASYAAPKDQRLKEGFFHGNESVVLKNMHPEKPLIKTKLPGIRVRGFFKGARFEKKFFEELTMELDKIWIFPHLETGILIWHAITSIADEEASEVTDLLVFPERIDEPEKPLEYYLAMTGQEEPGEPPELQPLQELRPGDTDPADASLLTAAAVAAATAAAAAMPGHSADALEQANPVLVALQREIEDKEAKLKQMLSDLGIDYEKQEEGKSPPASALLGAAGPEELLKILEQRISEAGKEFDKMLSDLGVDTTSQPSPLSTQPVLNPEEIIENMKRAGVDDAGLFSMIMGLGSEYAILKVEIEKLLKEQESFHAPEPEKGMKAGEPEALPEPESAALTRDHVLAGYKAGRSFEGTDLTGIDLSGCDLKGICLRGAVLEKVNLSGADFSGADLTDAILTGADLTKCRMAGAELSGASASAVKAGQADFSSARLQAADLSKADLTESCLTKALLEEADLEGASMKKIICREMSGNGARFAGADLTGADMSAAALAGADFTEAVMDNAVFQGADLSEADFSGSKGECVSFRGAKMALSRAGENAAFGKTDISGADLTAASWQDCRFEKCSFTDALLDEAHFVKCSFSGSNLSGASAKESCLDNSDFTDANMTGMNLFKGSLRKSVLLRTDLRNSNLFALEFYKAVFRDTNIQGANVKRTFFERLTPDGRTTWRWTREEERMKR